MISSSPDPQRDLGGLFPPNTHACRAGLLGVLMLTKLQRGEESLSRARGSIFGAKGDVQIEEGFLRRGIVATPRVDVFTYAAWFALGRQVRKGEHGEKGLTWIPVPPRARDLATNPNAKGGVRPKTYTVFHVSQTDPIPGRESEYDPAGLEQARRASAAFAESMGA